MFKHRRMRFHVLFYITLISVLIHISLWCPPFSLKLNIKKIKIAAPFGIPLHKRRLASAKHLPYKILKSSARLSGIITEEDEGAQLLQVIISHSQLL